MSGWELHTLLSEPTATSESKDCTFKDYLDRLRQEFTQTNEELASLYRDITKATDSSSPYRGDASLKNTEKLTTLREQILKLEHKKNSTQSLITMLERRLKA